MKPHERAALDRRKAAYLKAGYASCYEEDHQRLFLRFPNPEESENHWTRELMGSASVAGLSSDMILLLSLVHPSDASALVNQKGRLQLEKACNYLLIILARHLGDGIYESRPLYEDEEPADELLDRIALALDDNNLEEILDCDDCATWFRAAPQRRRAQAAAQDGWQDYRASTTRRGPADIEAIKNAIYVFAQENLPVTVRQTFYHLVSLAMVHKTEGEYDHTVIRLMLEMRRGGELPYAWVSDNTRWVRKPRTFDSVEEALTDCAATYRKALWRDLPVNVEVWCEKDALAGVIMEETVPYDVPLMVSRGFSSDSYLHQVAEQIQTSNKPTHIYYFGDWDPAGTCADKDLEKRLRAFCPIAEIHFERIAVSLELIEEMKLPMRPTKGEHMNRKFKGDSVDLDAIPPLELRRLVRECIEQHIPEGHLDVIQVAEKSERELLSKLTFARAA